MSDLYCPEHGPYDAALGVCPFCSPQRGRPRIDADPLTDEDDMLTDPGGNYGRDSYRGGEEDDPTIVPDRSGGRGGYLDEDDPEGTSIGKYRGNFDPDKTEIENNKFDYLGMFWVKEGQRRGSSYKIKDGTLIGRKTGGLIIDDPKVSEPHARLTMEDDAFVIWDCGSKNGTFVNGDRIRAATTLKENDTVKIGETTFVLKLLQ